MNIFEKMRIKKEMKKTPSGLVESLAKQAGQVVELPWNGEKNTFEIHEVNFIELMSCGKFPNMLATFVKTYSEKSDEKISEERAKEIKKEQDVFFHELARKSMINPPYAEVYEAIKSRLPEYEEGDTIIPQDFLLGLYSWYLRRFNELLKKNLKALNSKGSGE